jgi:cell division protein FtsX
LIAVKHSQVTLKHSRDDSLKELIEKSNNRENQLAIGIETLQTRYCVTVKDLEDLIEMQKKLLNKMKKECKTLNDQLEVLAIKYKYILEIFTK